jgi:hypothetical protein
MSQFNCPAAFCNQLITNKQKRAVRSASRPGRVRLENPLGHGDFLSGLKLSGERDGGLGLAWSLAVCPLGGHMHANGLLWHAGIADAACMGLTQLRKIEQSFCCAVVWHVYYWALCRATPRSDPTPIAPTAMPSPPPFASPSPMHCNTARDSNLGSGNHDMYRPSALVCPYDAPIHGLPHRYTSTPALNGYWVWRTLTPRSRRDTATHATARDSNLDSSSHGMSRLSALAYPHDAPIHGITDIPLCRQPTEIGCGTTPLAPRPHTATHAARDPNLGSGNRDMPRLSALTYPHDAPIHGLADIPLRLLPTDIGCGPCDEIRADLALIGCRTATLIAKKAAIAGIT